MRGVHCWRHHRIQNFLYLNEDRGEEGNVYVSLNLYLVCFVTRAPNLPTSGIPFSLIFCFLCTCRSLLFSFQVSWLTKFKMGFGYPKPISACLGSYHQSPHFLDNLCFTVAFQELPRRFSSSWGASIHASITALQLCELSPCALYFYEITISRTAFCQLLSRTPSVWVC